MSKKPKNQQNGAQKKNLNSGLYLKILMPVMESINKIPHKSGPNNLQFLNIFYLLKLTMMYICQCKIMWHKIMSDLPDRSYLMSTSNIGELLVIYFIEALSQIGTRIEYRSDDVTKNFFCISAFWIPCIGGAWWKTSTAQIWWESVHEAQDMATWIPY